MRAPWTAARAAFASSEVLNDYYSAFIELMSMITQSPVDSLQDLFDMNGMEFSLDVVDIEAIDGSAVKSEADLSISVDGEAAPMICRFEAVNTGESIVGSGAGALRMNRCAKKSLPN